MDKIILMCNSRNQILERQILCHILLSRAIPANLRPEYFSGKEAELYISILDQFNKNKEIDIEFLKISHGGTIISECLDMADTGSVVAINELKNHWIKRGIGRMMATVDTTQEPETLAQEIQIAAANMLIAGKVKKYLHSEAVDRLSKIVENGILNKKEIIGYRLGLKLFDETINGIEKGKFYVLGALKKTGKSRFMIYAAIRMAEQGAGILINSCEMNPDQLNACALAYFSGVGGHKIGRSLAQYENEKVCEAYSPLFNLNWSIYREYSVADLQTRILAERQDKNIDVVFVDFIQRMHHQKYGNDRVREVEAISQELADLARNLDVAVIALSQLSGIAEKLPADEIPNMSHFKESQAITENADAIIVLHNPLRNVEAWGVIENQIYKPPVLQVRIEQRYGISGGKFAVTADLRTCRFSDSI
jgi:replicative DNA helicase